MLPVAIASGVHGVSELRAAFSGARAYTLDSTGRSSAKHIEITSESISKIKKQDELLYGSMILSEGYGIEDESDKRGELVRLPNPLDMKADSAGEKPYPTVWNTDGDIVRLSYDRYSGNAFFDLENGGQVNNKTDIPNETLKKESSFLPNFTVSDTDEPLVLIYHTHTTESYEPYVREHYDSSFNYRTTDNTKNVVMVGDAIQAELEAQGIGVIHATAVHDYPSYNGSYGRSRETIMPILEKYPSIKVVLDIHRDAISAEGVAYQPFVEIDGREASQTGNAELYGKFSLCLCFAAEA